MSANPKISVVTPCLNMGKYLEDAILSVARQGYPNFEHIVVDACSKDNTLEILKRYPHLRWVSEPDQGQSDGLNKGFRMASGDIVGWLNADEYYLPGAFQTIAQGSAETPGADVYYSDGIFVDEQGRLTGTHSAHDFDLGILLYYGCYIATVNAFFKRTIFEEGLLIDEDYKIVMDFEYFVWLARAGKTFCYVPGVIGAFRWTGSNASLRAAERRRERLKVQRQFSAHKLPDYGYDALFKAFQLKRVLRKTVNGNYGRELAMLQHAGQPTDWFRSEEGRRTCASLLEEYSGEQPLRAPSGHGYVLSTLPLAPQSGRNSRSGESRMSRIGKLWPLLSLAAVRPLEFIDRAEVLWQARKRNGLGRKQASAAHAASVGWEDGVRELAKALECDAAAILGEPELLGIQRLVAERTRALATNGVPFPITYNADSSLAKLCYLLCRALKPETVLETGVGYGVTSATILAALDKNRRGGLFSIDLPPLGDREGTRVGCMVPGELRRRWQLYRGSSKRLLPGLLARSVARVNLFVHDSANTYETQKRELETVWEHLDDSGAILLNNIGTNGAFMEFVEEKKISNWLAVEQNEKIGHVTGIIVRG